MPRSFPFGAARQALLDRIATHGVVERLVSDVDDDSRGASIDFKAGLEVRPRRQASWPSTER